MNKCPNLCRRILYFEMNFEYLDALHRAEGVFLHFPLSLSAGWWPQQVSRKCELVQTQHTIDLNMCCRTENVRLREREHLNRPSSKGATFSLAVFSTAKKEMGRPYQAVAAAAWRSDAVLHKKKLGFLLRSCTKKVNNSCCWPGNWYPRMAVPLFANFFEKEHC